MKNSPKVLLLILLMFFMIITLTACGQGNASNNNPDGEIEFLEIGGKYYIIGFLGEVTGSGPSRATVYIEVIDINKNWIKIRPLEHFDGNVYNDLERRRQQEWDYLWINFDHIMGITK